MIDDGKLKDLKERIDTAKSLNTPPPKKRKKVALDLVLKLVQKSLPHWL